MRKVKAKTKVKKNKIFRELASVRLDLEYKVKTLNSVADIANVIKENIFNHKDSYFNNLEVVPPHGTYLTEEVRSGVEDFLKEYDISVIWGEKGKIEIKVNY